LNLEIHERSGISVVDFQAQSRSAHRKEVHPKWEEMAGDDDDDDDNDDARQVSFTQGTVLSPWTGEMKLEIQIRRPEA
jgi:hypothetical protein